MTAAQEALLTAVQRRLREAGLTLEFEQHGLAADAGFDATITLSRGTNHERYAVVVQRQATLSALARRPLPQPPHHLLVACDRINRRSAAALRGAGIQFADTLGNSYIAFGDVLVDVQGRTDRAEPASGSDDRTNRPQQPINLFSARRSQVVLSLLTWPELAAGTIRAVSAAAGVSVGQAHSALSELDEAGYLAPGSHTVHRFDELLEFWASAYPTGLGRTLELARYRGNPSRPVQQPQIEQPFYLSGESARGTDIARPATLTIYVDSLHPLVPIVNRWNASPDEAPNVFVRRKFWHCPSTDEKVTTSTGRNAPWPLVYADLLATGDSRLREVATTWRNLHARPDGL